MFSVKRTERPHRVQFHGQRFAMPNAGLIVPLNATADDRTRPCAANAACHRRPTARLAPFGASAGCAERAPRVRQPVRAGVPLVELSALHRARV
jgi:hypothetical protein